MKAATLLSFVILTAFLAACAPIHQGLPPHLALKAVEIGPDAPDYNQANLAAAVKQDGDGGISRGIVVRITEPVTVYRLWSGPKNVNARGQTNRIGQWWSYDAPSGERQRYRADYEICHSWNELTWVATCVLAPGSVVAIGPGQSVSEKTCEHPGESYPANEQMWQTYVDKAWARPQELVCPDPAQDYANDPSDIAKRLDTK